MTRRILTVFIVACIVSFSTGAKAHFGLILPDDDILEDQSHAHIHIIAAFCHPFELSGMDLEMPQKFGLFLRGKEQDLTKKLKLTTFLKHKAWELSCSIKRPGDHIFYMIPKPYWEEMEGKYIQHITKVIVSAYGLENHWDRPVGLPAEIVPLSRPYGLWAGNSFCAKVLLDGKPAQGIEVEVERLNNTPPRLKAPKSAFITQVIRTNEQGDFCYTMPVSGWWGFSALTEEENALEHLGRPVPLEVGAVIWIKAATPTGE